MADQASQCEEILNHIKKNKLLKGHSFSIYEYICMNRRVSERDLFKKMSITNCFPSDRIKDLLAWGCIKVIGVALHKEIGAANPVYCITGKLPLIPDLIAYYEDLH